MPVRPTPPGVGTATRPRPLNAPVRVKIRVDPDGFPRTIVLRGRRLLVVSVAERWRIDEGWWRDIPLSRLYYRLVLVDGRLVTVFHDLRDTSWWTQRS